MNTAQKIKTFEELKQIVSRLKEKGKKVVQCHGTFDIIHPGIIKHVESARRQGDILIVTVVKDKDVRKGPSYPIFSENLRAENIASIGHVDYVSIVDDYIPFESVKVLKPDIFARGQDYKDRDPAILVKLEREEDSWQEAGCKIHYTPGKVSSTNIINQFLDFYPEETRNYLKNFRKKYKASDILNLFESLKKTKVLIVGDAIIDEYHYCTAMNRSSKASLVVNKYLAHEVFAGGVFSIASNVAQLCNNVHLVTLLGDNNSREDFILKKLDPRIEKKFFYRKDGTTTLKKRYVDQYLNQKLFEINYLDDNYINKDCESEVVNYLKSEIPKYDLVLVSDFGHGFITGKIITMVEKFSKKVAVNTQTNAANTGFNMITKYYHPHYVCLDEGEARWATQERFTQMELVLKKLSKILNTNYLIVTLGKKGSMGIDKEGKINTTPIFSLKVVDTVGAGDAFFAYTAPCFAQNMPLELVSFIGNTVGALAVQIVCNKKPVEKEELIQFIHSLLE